jgi:glycosyltransferase involved in cell wall biosynthesis
VAGPRLAAGLGIPYVVAEGSRAPKRAGGPWDAGHRLAEAALDAADLVLVLNERDRPGLERSRPARQQIESLPPFVDGDGWPHGPARTAHGQGAGPLRLLAVAMMRWGDKAASYALLAEALGRLDARDWTLAVAGDGPERRDVEALFAPFGNRVVFHGRVDEPVALARLYASADLLVWPAVNEAFGMVFLEAALQGCPALAGAFGGVSGVVVDGVTGRLAEPGSAEAFAAALAELGRDRGGLRRMGEAARRFAREDRSLDRAAARLSVLLGEVVRRRSAA